MVISLLSIFVAILTTFIAISLLRPFAINIQLTDSPNSRKKHEGRIPLIGGLAMFIGFLVSIFTTSIDLNQIKYFFLASFIVVIIGALDDHQDISVKSRLFFQIVAAMIVAAVAGINIESLGYLLAREEILLNSWSIFFTIVAIIGAINAVNMTDGINGLAGLNCLITFLAIIYFSILGGNQESLTIAILMSAVIPPFLIENLCIGRPKEKRIFMGDAGSMFLGLGVAWLLIALSQGESKAFSPVIALWLFAVPLIDTISTVLRRILNGKSPFKPDMSHIHHILISMGFSSKFVLIIILILNLAMAIMGIIGELIKVDEWKMFFSFLLIFIVYFVVTNYLISNQKNDLIKETI
jgi:UDP-GlcNAc:undecaprenyl-phosphate GlcNAc-1-phosphate transferase